MRRPAVLVVDEAFADFIPEISVAAMVNKGSGSRGHSPSFRDTWLAARLPRLRRRGARPEAPTFVAGQRRRRCRRHRSVRDGFAEASVAEVARLRGDLFRALDDLDGLQPFPGAANFLLVRGPEGLAGRLARRGVLVRGCGPFMGLGPEFFGVAVRGEAENGRLISALREEL